MSNLYNNIVELCEKRGISGYRMCKEVGIQPSVLTDMKMGRKIGVSAATADKIATYFGVSVAYLLGTEETENDAELQTYLDALKNRDEMRMLFSLAEGCTKEEVEQAVRIIEALRKKD